MEQVIPAIANKLERGCVGPNFCLAVFINTQIKIKVNKLISLLIPYGEISISD